MLPAQARLRKSPDFAATLRSGRRAGRPALVATVLRAERASQDGELGASSGTMPARVGFVVGRRIGGAVVRNRLRRRLQHVTANHLDWLPVGSRTVVRALPGAERLRYADLSRELRAVFDRALR